ncbi:MAG: alpha-galactosidase [Thermodesulfobacteriota bacterium]|nr:alpha-galactosidase [Thermodesulfobacteriota bacterium]
MGIHFDKDSGIFHLRANNTSYIMKVTPQGDIVHLYWGRSLRQADPGHLWYPSLRAFSPSSHPGHDDLSYNTMPMEYPFYGNGDFRLPAFEVDRPDGSCIVRPVYFSHDISRGKPLLYGLPATYVEAESEAETLVIRLFDPLCSLEVSLVYTAYEAYDVITRSVVFHNKGKTPIMLGRAMSMNVDFRHCAFKMVHLCGSWARERDIEGHRLVPGIQSIESRRGASSHQHNPFFALMADNAGEEHGEVYGVSLVYSGNFLGLTEVDEFGGARVSMGINPFGFSWELGKDASFQTPEAVLVFSGSGLGSMSRQFHSLYRKRLCKGEFRDRPRPVLINNWEATYFDFNMDRLLEIARQAKDLGVELFCLDDGWFGHRNDDNCCLGDWYEDRSKLPDGLSGLARKVLDLGMEFGLWMEPEMVSKNSDLYREHPDWCLHVPGRQQTESRNQLVLDLSRDEVCDWIVHVIADVLSSAPITYVKWDMNRNMTEVFSVAYPAHRQGEIFHRYILGLYRILDELNDRFPHILFEGCAGGGGRFDPGMLYYMPQIWTSDNTDAISRLQIQYGTSLVYPPITMGAHLSDVPNHQILRTTPLVTRLNTAMSANLGLELDLSKQEQGEKTIVREQIRRYKDMRPLIQFGDFYRLLSPFEGNHVSWIFVSEDKQDAALFYWIILAEPHGPQAYVRLKGLDTDLDYRLVDYDAFLVALGYDEVYPGDMLMHAGLRVPPLIGDFQSCLLRFSAE